jgi:hypothetical protein
VDVEVGKEAAKGRRGCGWVWSVREEVGFGLYATYYIPRKHDNNHQLDDRRPKIIAPIWASLVNIFLFIFHLIALL